MNILFPNISVIVEYVHIVLIVYIPIYYYNDKK